VPTLPSKLSLALCQVTAVRAVVLKRRDVSREMRQTSRKVSLSRTNLQDVLVPPNVMEQEVDVYQRAADGHLVQRCEPAASASFSASPGALRLRGSARTAAAGQRHAPPRDGVDEPLLAGLALLHCPARRPLTPPGIRRRLRRRRRRRFIPCAIQRRMCFCRRWCRLLFRVGETGRPRRERRRRRRRRLRIDIPRRRTACAVYTVCTVCDVCTVCTVCTVCIRCTICTVCTVYGGGGISGSVGISDEMSSVPYGRVGTFPKTLFAVKHIMQMMTPRVVHVTNLTPPGRDSASREYGQHTW
jgi:hypothetical protein